MREFRVNPKELPVCGGLYIYSDFPDKYKVGSSIRIGYAILKVIVRIGKYHLVYCNKIN